MIREFIKQTLIIYALIVLALLVVPLFFIEDYYSQPVAFLLHIFGLTIGIRITILAIQLVDIKIPMIEYFIDFVLVLIEVMGTSWLFGWITKESLIIFPIIILFVFAATYVLNALRIQKDISMINQQIKMRRE